MAQDNAGSGYPEPGPDTFNFEDYLEGNATFPVFKHTAYLDQKSGSELGDVMDDLEEAVEQQKAIDEQIDKRRQQNAGAFVDSTMDGFLENREEVEQRITELLERRDKLREKILATRITLNFQVKTPEELGAVTREATRQFHKENQQYKNATDDDLDYITARSRYTLTAQIAHFCTGMQLHDGREVPPPTRAGAEKLLKSLIASETMRLMESVGTGLSASREWAEQLDAGFPGGSTDVEVVGVGSDGPQGRKVVGDSAADNADRQGNDLVGRTEPETGYGLGDSGGRDLQGVRDSSLGRALDKQ